MNYAKINLQKLSDEELTNLQLDIKNEKDNREEEKYKTIRKEVKGNHYYLNKIGIRSNDTSVFNSTNIENGNYTGRTALFKEQRKTYGFDEKETWNLNYTYITWLYSHLKFYLDYTPVDLTFHKFKVPILEERKKKRKENSFFKEVAKELTQEDAIKLALEYMESYLSYLSEDPFLEHEMKQIEKVKCALKIVAEIFTVLWW